MYRLFLDDIRQPYEVGNYINPVELRKQYRVYEWVIVRNYPAFVKYITDNGIPNVISFDHDLADGHYHSNMQNGVLNYKGDSFEVDMNKTGYHCAQWLIDYVIEHNKTLPEYFVHSMNPVGKENIISLFKSFKNFNYGTI
jgi:hypothetical protein